MDTLLVGGDHFPDSRGLPAVVEGDAEAVQRALIRLGVRRGALAGAPGLGSDLHRLRGAGAQALGRLAHSYVLEALAPMAEWTVRDVAAKRLPDGALAVTVALARRDTVYNLEVLVN